jgi:IS605 OrfB family transposase
MSIQRTIGLRINKHPELIRTIREYNDIVNLHIKKSVELKTNSKKILHQMLYKEIRLKHPTFPSALIQNARDNSVEMLKGNKNNKNTFKRLDSSIRFDLRTCKVFLDSGQLSITTVEGRKKYHIKIPEYFNKYKNWKVKQITLGTDKKDLRLKVIVEGVIEKQMINKSVLGIDLGLKNFVVSSDGEHIKAKKVKGIKRCYNYLRKKLQSVGTCSAKKFLKKLSGRERRFQTDYNHCLSKKIVNKNFGVIAFEDLTGIRRQSKKSKKFNRMISNWAFRQLQSFTSYKAEFLGKTVLFVNPSFTSQTCSVCGDINKDNRNKGLFYCLKCHNQMGADLNASKNISRLGAILFEQVDVNQPIVSGTSSSLQNKSFLDTSHVLKTRSVLGRGN